MSLPNEGGFYAFQVINASNDANHMLEKVAKENSLGRSGRLSTTQAEDFKGQHRSY